ncbi:MAG: hypothetical protein JSV17_17540 [Candidatus Aminicenantes bacterium]|nr:MAG: hypothetical protein JSV17_17540 [Candidatus Aminicenantes bacterium]
MVLRKTIIAMAILSVFVPQFFSFERLEPDWIERLNYRADELYPIKLQINSIPLVEVKVNGSNVWVNFDTGCSTGFSLTSAVEDTIEHKVTGKSTERNPDGSYRGETTLATIASLEVFGVTYAPVKTSFTDWRIFSILKFNGLLGLKYFKDKRVTIDYKQKKIGITDKPFVYANDKKFSGAVVPLLEASGSQADLIYVLGRIRGQPTVIYMDTGSSASFIDPSMLDTNEIKKGERYLFIENVEMAIGNLAFTVRQLRVKEQRRGVNFEYPQTVKLGSDVIKDFLITIDKIDNKLFLAKN